MKNKQKKLLLLLIPMLILLSGCGVTQGNLVTEWGQGFWQNFVFVFSWMIVKASLILNNNLVFGLVAVTLLVRILMIPLFAAQIKSSTKMQELQPQLAKLKEKYAGRDDQETKTKIAQETQAIYTKNGVNPLAGCLPSLIQMPLLFVFYGAIQNLFIFSESAVLTEGDVIGASAYYAEGTEFSLSLLGMDMNEVSIVFAVLAAATTWYSTKLSSVGQDPNAQGAQMMKTMMIMMPIMILMFGFTQPGALALYWFTGNCVTIGQTLYFKRHKIKQARDQKKIEKAANKK